MSIDCVGETCFTCRRCKSCLRVAIINRHGEFVDYADVCRHCAAKAARLLHMGDVGDGQLIEEEQRALDPRSRAHHRPGAVPSVAVVKELCHEFAAVAWLAFDRAV